jgi:hypothetical protein
MVVALAIGGDPTFSVRKLHALRGRCKRDRQTSWAAPGNWRLTSPVIGKS